jgi:hypothetical protein
MTKKADLYRSVTDPDPHSIGFLDPDPHSEWGSRSGSVTLPVLTLTLFWPLPGAPLPPRPLPAPCSAPSLIGTGPYLNSFLASACPKGAPLPPRPLPAPCSAP